MRRYVDTQDGVSTYFDYDELEDKTYIQRVQDVEPNLNITKQLYNDAPETGRYKGEMVRVASVPVVVLEEYCKQRGIAFEDFMKDRKEWKKFLDDPDNKFFRTLPGKV